jgi:hypothetical protein
MNRIEKICVDSQPVEKVGVWSNFRRDEFFLLKSWTDNVLLTPSFHFFNRLLARISVPFWLRPTAALSAPRSICVGAPFGSRAASVQRAAEFVTAPARLSLPDYFTISADWFCLSQKFSGQHW